MITVKELGVWVSLVYFDPFGGLEPTEAEEQSYWGARTAKECAQYVAENPMPTSADPDDWALSVLRTLALSMGPEVSHQAGPRMGVPQWWRWFIFHLKRYAHRNDEAQVLATMFIDASDVEDTNGGDLADALDAWLAAGGDGAQ